MDGIIDAEACKWVVRTVVEQQDDGAVEEAHVRLPGHQQTALLRLRDQMRPATGALRARAVGELNRVCGTRRQRGKGPIRV
jgi:hypothetical protein